MATITPTQLDIRTAMAGFLAAVLPTEVEIIIAQENRVSEPAQPTFVIITFIRFDRLRTNIDASADVRFTGRITGTALTVSSISYGVIKVGAQVFGDGVAADTRIISGSGLNWQVSKSQNLSSRVLSSGARAMQQGADCVLQLDFHDAGDGVASDLVQIVSTTYRDAFAAQWFKEHHPDLPIAPLYCENPRQAPFINESLQYEWRWILETHLQVDQTVSMPQQYADVVDVDVISVDARFPP